MTSYLRLRKTFSSACQNIATKKSRKTSRLSTTCIPQSKRLCRVTMTTYAESAISASRGSVRRTKRRTKRSSQRGLSLPVSMAATTGSIFSVCTDIGSCNVTWKQTSLETNLLRSSQKRKNVLSAESTSRKKTVRQ